MKFRWLLGLALAVSASAQPREPHLAYVYPAGARQGTTVTVAIGGQTLVDAKAIHFSGLGVQARIVGYTRPLTQKEINDLRDQLQALQEKRSTQKSALTPEEEKRVIELRVKLASRSSRQVSPALAETVTIEVTLAADAAPGTRELRVRTANGLSNPFAFVVGQLPEHVDPVVTATNTPAPRANPAGEPRVAPRFRTDTRVELPVVLNGQVLPAEIDYYRFSAKRGQRIVGRVSARALNPYLADAVPGWFQPTLALYDPQGRELAYDDDYQFDPDPALMAEIPADGEYVLAITDAIYRGREDFVYRVAVGELSFVTSIFPLGGKVAGQATFELSGWNLPAHEFVLDTTDKSPGIFGIGMRSGTDVASPARFELDRLPECGDLPDEKPAQRPQMLALPTIVNGRIDRPGEEDVFRFEGRSGDVVVAEVVARRLGSPLDSVLRLTDATGKQLAYNDDCEDRGSGLLTHHADSRINFTLPADGMYFLHLTDAQHHGGAAYSYRLHVGPPRPDFELRVVPSAINVRAGGTTTVTVYALRRDGFEGDIAIGMRGTPANFILSGARIPANQDKISLTLTAPYSTRENLFDVEFIGAAKIAGSNVAHVATPADDLMQAFAYHHLVPAREAKVCVAGRGATLRPIGSLPVQIADRRPTHVRVSLPVNAGRSLKNVHVELVNAPEGIAIKESSLGGEVVEIQLACDPAKAKPGLRGNLLFNVFGERGNANGKANAQRTPLGSVPALPFEVVSKS